MWGILGFLAKFGGWLLDRFLSSKERELGRVEAEREGLRKNVKQTKTALDARRSVKHDADSVLDDPANRDRR